MLLHRGESKVPLRQSKYIVTAKCAVYRHINACHRLAHHLLVRLAPKTVDENACKVQFRVIGAKPECSCCDRDSCRFCINDEEYRSPQQLRNRSS